MHALSAEIRQSIRALLAQPAWTVAALICLAIGTGANTAAFTLINGILLRPLPFDESHQIVMIAIRPSQDRRAGPVSLDQFRELEPAAAEHFQQIAIRTYLPVGVAAEGQTRMVQSEFVSSGYFDLLQIRPLAGRWIAPGQTEAIVSERLWRSLFAEDPAMTGRTIRINGRPVVIAGVAPAGFVGAMRLIAADLWLPSEAYGVFASPEAPREAEIQPVFGLLARLKSQATLPQARERLNAILINQWRQNAGSPSAPSALIEEGAGFGVPPGLRQTVVGGSVILFALMGLLVAVAVANVAGLMLARATGRAKETAIRLALGATRYRIVRQVLIESVLLAICGAALGALMTFALPSLISGLGPTLPEHLSFAVDIRPDWRTGVYATLSAIATAALFGLAPARKAAGTDSSLAMRESAGNSRGPTTTRTLNMFVVGQLAVSTVLLVITILLSHTYVNTRAVDPGIDTRNALAVSLDWKQTGLDRAKGRAFYEGLLNGVASLPGVRYAALTSRPPLTPGGASVPVSVDGLNSFSAGASVVTSHYFDAVGTPLLQGRNFRPADSDGAPVAIVNETMARRLTGRGSPLGMGVTIGKRRLEIVGVVRDAKYRSLAEPPQPVFFEPFGQKYSAEMTLLARTASAPHLLIEPLRREIRSRNPDLAAISIRTLEDQFEEATAPSRQRALVLGAACSIGLLLSAFGLFGVMSYEVRQRVRELGVRMAIGARPFDIGLLVIQQAFRLMAAGLVIGLALALIATRIVASVLFGASFGEPVTIGLVVLLLSVVAFTAAFLPARWAMRVEPIRAIRSE